MPNNWWNTNPDETEAQKVEREIQELEARKALNTKCLLDLAALGIQEVKVVYSGSSDSGSIESTKGFKGDVEVDLNETLDDWIENRILNLLPDGWEINEGSQGTATLDVSTGLISIEHGTNVTTVDYEDLSEELDVEEDFDVQLLGSSIAM